MRTKDMTGFINPGTYKGDFKINNNNFDVIIIKEDQTDKLIVKSPDNDFNGYLQAITDKPKLGWPDFKGKATLNGISYEIAAWINTSNKGAKEFKYLNCKVQTTEKNNPINLFK
jgi:hypothetical protein